MTIPTLKCLRCGYTWIPRTEEPRNCPRCHSPYWNEPRKKIAVTFEEVKEIPPIVRPQARANNEAKRIYKRHQL